MKVVDLTDVSRHDSPIQYRRSYVATARFALPTGESIDRKVEFTLEKPPIGKMKVVGRLLETLDYPLMPALRALHAYIRQVDQNGGLP